MAAGRTAAIREIAAAMGETATPMAMRAAPPGVGTLILVAAQVALRRA